MNNQHAEFDAYAVNYDETVNRSVGFTGLDVDYFTRVKADYLIEILSARLGATHVLDLLDVGCGTGNSHALIADRLGSISGTDVSSACLAQAAQRNPTVAYRDYDGTRLPYKDARYDAVVTTCVLHHVPPAQWPGLVAEMRRVLRPGGIAVIFEHNPYNPLTRRAVANCPFDADAVLLSQRRTRALLDGAGFGKSESRSILTLPVFGPLTRGIDRVFGRLPLGAQYYAVGVA